VSVQATHLGLEGIADDALLLPGGERRAVLEVGSVNFALQGERDQETTVLGFAAFLNGLTFPVQVLVRVLPVDVARYLEDLERRARGLPGPLADLALDHVAFLRRLARSRTLLERRFYVVVPAHPEPGGERWWPFPSRPQRPTDEATTRRQLGHRCAEIERQLLRCGLSARRLADVELAQLLHACWCPDLARTQRLRQSLAEATALVVRASGGQV
jgi:hypothetical protein